MAVSIESLQMPGNLAGMSRAGRVSREPWELRISFVQMISLWLLAGLAMLTVFIFGFHRGRSQGLAAAFEEYAEQSVRLPVVQPVALPSAGSAAESASSNAANSYGAKVENSTSGAGIRAGKNQVEQANTESGFDFSALKANSASSPGLAGKPALELFSGAITAGEGKNGLKKAAQSSGQTEPQQTVESRTKLAALPAGSKVNTASTPAEQTTEAAGLPPAKTTEANEGSAAAKKLAPVATKSIAPGWYVQASADKSAKDAARATSRLKAAGFAPVLEKADIQGKTYFRVLVGPYASRDNAVKAGKRITTAKLSRGEPFARLVK